MLGSIYIYIFFSMRDVFYTTTRPRHAYKSERFFRGYFRSRKRSGFGVRSRGDFLTKMLTMKKFFRWYFRIAKIAYFRKLFTRQFIRKQYTFEALTMFFHLLERNLLVLLVRSRFCSNFDHAYSLVRSQFVFVNGIRTSVPFFTTRLGDIIELAGWARYSLYYRLLFFLIPQFVLFRLFYFRNLFCFDSRIGFFNQSQITRRQNILGYLVTHGMTTKNSLFEMVG